MRKQPRKLSQQLKQKKDEFHSSARNATLELNSIQNETQRLAGIVRNAPQIIDNLDKDFEDATSLTSFDIKFLFIAVAIQCVRQYVFSSDAFRMTAKENDKLVEKAVPKKWHDILLDSVPYDATQRTPEMQAMGSTGLSGFTHRYRTLGHDPLFGWVFGPINIITDSLTKSDIITTYKIENKKIAAFYEGGTFGAANDSLNISLSDKIILPTAVLRQALHFGTDYFTKQGLPIPILSSVNNDLSKKLIENNIDMYSIARAITLTWLINSIVQYTHALFYNEERDKNRDLFSVRTHKIVTYSNVIASASNIIYVAVSSMLGDKTALKKLDVGGILVTLYRLCTDAKYISQIKLEFLENNFANLILNVEK